MVENKMEAAYARKDEGCPKLLGMIQNDREWIEEKKLELRLGPPDGTFGCFSNPISGNKRAFKDSTINKDHVFSLSPSNIAAKSNHHQTLMLHLQQQQPSYLKESSHHCSSSTTTTTTTVDLQAAIEKKAFSPPQPPANTAVSNANSVQKRSGPAPVVGWPPVRSFRRNLASSSNLNPNHVSDHNGVSNKICNEKSVENNQKGLFVKINMDGVPIGRKVDLKVYDSYEKLSSAVDDLFRGLLAAQGDTSACGTKMKGEGEKVISGVLDGSGEYALVYEDNEGDRMLVGDVPWQMFISTVKRLRVLKTAEISLHCKGGSKAKEVLT